MGIDMQCLFTTSCMRLHEHGERGGGGGKCGLVPISTCGPWISLLYKCRLGMEGGEYIGIKACFF